jgi:glycerophosphoryl diester phosphodiesterase
MSIHPLVLAHRGASAYAPENTFASFDLALQMGAPAFETDVRATANGHLVLLHDASVDRTTDGHGPVSSLTLAEVKALDAGSWFSSRFAGQRIPTLGEFLSTYGSKAIIRLEVKARDIEAQLVAEVKGAVDLSQVEFSSFSPESVARLCTLVPEARVGRLISEVDAEIIAEAVARGVRFLSVHANALSAEAIRAGRAAGLEVGAWGVNDDRLLAKMLSLGVDSFTTNWPDRALRLLGESGSH